LRYISLLERSRCPNRMENSTNSLLCDLDGLLSTTSDGQ
jgi:hypothetical protein